MESPTFHRHALWSLQQLHIKKTLLQSALDYRALYISRAFSPAETHTKGPSKNATAQIRH